jgi:hypothetical protein
MSALNRFHETANDALERISGSLPSGAKICLAIYTPEKPDLDIVLQDKGLDLNEVVSTLRRHGLSIDGDNAYKRDLCDSIVGAMVFGTQNGNPPPPGQWQQRFWDIARGEASAREELVEALNLVAGCLMDALAGVDIPAAKAGRAIATASEVIAKNQ